LVVEKIELGNGFVALILDFSLHKLL